MSIAPVSFNRASIGPAGQMASRPDMRSLFAAVLAGQNAREADPASLPARLDRSVEIMAAPAMPSRPPEHIIDRRRTPARKDDTTEQWRRRGDRRRPAAPLHPPLFFSVPE